MGYFIEYSFLGEEEILEILMAELSIIDFDTFEQLEGELKAYIIDEKEDEKYVKEISEKYNLTYKKNQIEKINWNKEWENNFESIEIKGKCTVRASFHDKTNSPIDLIINPKMSFGTGHHSTTYMMLEFILDEDMNNKDVCDLGCGTGILGILAKKKGARKIDALDIDEWSVANTKENIELNEVKNMNVFQGRVEDILDRKYDVILANINKNVLIDEIEKYSKILKEEGILFLSGFYTEDKKDILIYSEKQKLYFIEEKEDKNWQALKLKKIQK